MTPAIYSNGKIVTGLNHGDAFSKLSEEEKDLPLKSGFIDNHGNRFFTIEGEEIYIRQIILIRHAIHDYEHITNEGRQQAQKVAAFLNSMQIKEKEFSCFCSPKTRCKETAEEISKECQIKLETKEMLDEIQPLEQLEDFKKRIRNCFIILPKKSIIISHCDFIQMAIQLMQGHQQFVDIPNCSSTLIENEKVVFFAKQYKELIN